MKRWPYRNQFMCSLLASSLGACTFGSLLYVLEIVAVNFGCRRFLLAPARRMKNAGMEEFIFWLRVSSLENEFHWVLKPGSPKPDFGFWINPWLHSSHFSLSSSGIYWVVWKGLVILANPNNL